MNLLNLDSDVTIILSIVAALITGGLGLRRAQSMWSKDGSNIAQHGANSAGSDTQRAAQEAQQAIIELMRNEMERMSASNKEMLVQLTEFQRKNIQLGSDVASLTAQIGSFRTQNIELQAEIASLREMLLRWDSKCNSCVFKAEVSKTMGTTGCLDLINKGQ